MADTFGRLILESIPKEHKGSLESAYAWVASEIKSKSNGRILVTAGAVEHWIKGRRVPPTPTLGLLAELFSWPDETTAGALRLLAQPVYAEAA